MKLDPHAPVLVTTDHRGVFFGYLESAIRKESLVLDRMRNAVSWGERVGGFLGLAASGPDDSSAVSVAAPGLSTLFDIMSVTLVSPVAVARWEAQTVVSPPGS